MPTGQPDIRDIKDIYSLYGWYRPLVYTLIALALLAAGPALWRYLRRKRPAPPPPPPPPGKSGRELAREEIVRLRALIGAENPKPFAFGLSEADPFRHSTVARRSHFVRAFGSDGILPVCVRLLAWRAAIR